MVKVEEILKLSADEKILLIEKIWDSLDSQDESFLSKEQQEEISKRIERHERGEGKTYTWKEIESHLRFK